MKTILTLCLFLATQGAFAANLIHCKTEGERSLAAKLVRTGPDTFKLTLRDDVATGYASVEDETVELEVDATENADVLSNWNGNWGTRLTFRKGFLAQRAGAKSHAFVKAEYNDIAEDVVKTVVACEVIR